MSKSKNWCSAKTKYMSYVLGKSNQEEIVGEQMRIGRLIHIITNV